MCTCCVAVLHVLCMCRHCPNWNSHPDRRQWHSTWHKCSVCRKVKDPALSAAYFHISMRLLAEKALQHWRPAAKTFPPTVSWSVAPAKHACTPCLHLQMDRSAIKPRALESVSCGHVWLCLQLADLTPSLACMCMTEAHALFHMPSDICMLPAGL